MVKKFINSKGSIFIRIKYFNYIEKWGRNVFLDLCDDSDFYCIFEDMLYFLFWFKIVKNLGKILGKFLIYL